MTMQAKDIPAGDVLESIHAHGSTAGIYTLWADDFPDVPFKVFKAKMDKLRKQGLAGTCCNECNSWISLTPRGAERIGVAA